jgi:PAS domain S-box-containing protein
MMSANKSTILYIDDDLLNLEIFKEFFSDTYHVISLSSTEKALDVLRSNPVKVLISDQCMPYETGIEFIRRINPEFPDIIKMILTAYTDHDVALEAINDIGIYKYLLKPWDSVEVSNTIENCIREFDLREENKQLITALKQNNDALNEAIIKLDENEKKFHTIFATSNDSIFILNHRKEVIEANQALYNLLGIKDKTHNLEILNASIRDKFPVLLHKPLELSKSPDTSISEIDLKINQGETKTIELNCNRISYVNNQCVLSVVRDISERRTFEKKIVEAIISTQEEDQSKYARELHDGLGPLLSTLKMHIEWIADTNNVQNKDKIIQHSIHTIDNAIRSVKEIANNMSPHILQRFGLVEAINSYIYRLKETSKIEFVVSSNLKDRIASNIEIVLYRILLEIINNAIKHSDAKKVILKFNKQKNALQINCSDNGKGFDVTRVMSEGQGMGIFNMQNRIKHIGGGFKIISNMNIGTDITINLDN